MNPSDWAALIHPAIAVVFVFPLVGISVNFAWQTRQRRLQTQAGGKSKIPAIVGREHLQAGKWLSTAVVALTLLGFAYPIAKNILANQLWEQDSWQVSFILLMFVLTVASLAFLHRARQKHWRGIFATLTGMGIIILGAQDGIFRRLDEWYWSHYLFGVIVALLMIFSLAIVEDIYQDSSHRWRYVHVILNCFALLLFVGQGLTGTRDLLEIPLSWQENHLSQCDWGNKTCPEPPQ
jgi:hypothetical protein